MEDQKAKISYSGTDCFPKKEKQAAVRDWRDILINAHMGLLVSTLLLPIAEIMDAAGGRGNHAR